MDNLAIDNPIRSSLESYGLEWIRCTHIVVIKPTKIDNVYYSIDHNGTKIMLLSLFGSSKECTPTLVSEYARKHSLPTYKYNNDVNQFRRYHKWLEHRNSFIKGFTKYGDNYYMVASREFYHYYSRYGFCAACGILRCSPVWCICGHKKLSDGWTSNNKKLDEFIKKSQLQTNSANDAYLEWIPFDCIHVWKCDIHTYGLPTYESVNLIPLEITDKTHDSYYAELCDKHPDILTTDVWVTIGVTYHKEWQGYCLIKEYGDGICLACTCRLEPEINAFCLKCKAPRPPNWTTGNKSLDSFIMESWSNTENKHDTYIQWIEYSLLINVRKITPLHGKCKLVADWLEPMANKWIKVTLKNIVYRQNAQLFDFHQLIKEYPKILTPENMLIIGITREPFTGEYYLVFHHETRPILDKIVSIYGHMQYMEYGDFDELQEIGSGSYRTVYTAKYKEHLVANIPETVVLKQFKKFDQTVELFLSEVRNHVKCTNLYRSNFFLQIYGVIQIPETEEYMIVMQYANNGSLLSYLGQNINNLTWKMKLNHLKEIADDLYNIHDAGLVHCDLHDRNIVLHNNNNVCTLFICDLGFSQSLHSPRSSLTMQGVLPFIAPEVFHTRKFTQKSDVYSFGIIMYLIATGEPPFRNREFDESLICDIIGGLRPMMPDSTPRKYKKLVELCCDADPDKRPNTRGLWYWICELIKTVDNDIWNAIYYNNNVTSQQGE